MKTEFVKSIDSTNTYLYEKALRGEFKTERAICAYMQLKGKGRRGRSFYSPDDTGLYLSLLLFPKCTVKEAEKITTMMAVSAAKAAGALSGEDVRIKWVNDLYLNGKKISGILTECSPDIADGRPSFVVTGIGINILMPEGGFPEDIRDKAGPLLQRIPEGYDSVTDFKRKLAARIIDEFEKIYADFPASDFIDEYRNLGMLDGTTVRILDGPSVTVMGIEDDFGLKVRHEDGSIEILRAGEISLVL